MKIFEVSGVGKLHGLTVMSLDAFVKDDEKEVKEAVEGRQKHKVAVTVSDPNHTAVSQRGETQQRMCSVTADSREQACDTAVNWYKKQGYRVHDHNYVGAVEDTVKEGVMSDLHLQFADVYDELSPGIEKHRDSFKAGQLYDALEAVAEKNGALGEFKRMMMGARNSAHQDYDTNPGGFENWFWYLPFGDKLAEAGMPSSVVKNKQRNASMTDQEFHQAHKDKSDDELKAMAWRHGYGKDSTHYVDKHKKGQTGVTEGRVDSPVSSAITRRILTQRHDLLKFGPQAVMDAVDQVAEWVGEVEEIGSSDVSAWVAQVARYLQTQDGQGVAEGGKTPKQYWNRDSQSIGSTPDDGLTYADPDEDGVHYPDYANTKFQPRAKAKPTQATSANKRLTDKQYAKQLHKHYASLYDTLRITFNRRKNIFSVTGNNGFETDYHKYRVDPATNKLKIMMSTSVENESINPGMAEGGEKYKVKSIGHDAKGDYYISPSTGKKVYKSGVERGDHENPNTGEIKKNIAEAPGDFGLGANYRAVPDAEMQDLMGRSKNKTKTKRDKFDYPYIHGSNIQVKDESGKTFDAEALKKSIMVRPGRILGQNAKMQHSETGTEAIFDIGLPALKGLAVNEKTGEFVVVDTCPGAGACKTFCYAMKGSYVMFKAVSMGLARMLNFLLNDPKGFASQLNAEIAGAQSKMAKKNAKVVVRWHDAGDFFSAEYLDMAYAVATANPDVGFYAYTKMADVATGQRPKNFNMNFSGGALSSQEKKIDFKRTKHSKVVPKDMFFDLIARDGTSLKKDAKGRMQFASPENLDQFKSIMAQKYAIDKDSILTYDEMMKTPVGDTPKWNTIVMPGDGDNSANRNDVIGSYLLFH